MKTKLLKKIRQNLVVRYSFKYKIWCISQIDCTEPTYYAINTKYAVEYICKILNIKRQQQTKLNRLIKVNH